MLCNSLSKAPLQRHLQKPVSLVATAERMLGFVAHKCTLLMSICLRWDLQASLSEA